MFDKNIAKSSQPVNRFQAAPWTLDGTVFGIHVHQTGTGTFYYAEYLESDGKYYAYYDVNDHLPSGTGIRNAREGSISLSGIQFQTGIRFRF